MDKGVHIIRETSRNTLQYNRRRLRDEETDVRRSIAEQRISTANVTEIANKLRNKSEITLTELQALKNAIINDSSNIGIVLNTNGALRGLVREITGHAVCRQRAAAGSACNLALGDARAGAALARAAGSYLIAALDNLTIDFAVTCAWSIGNLAGSGSRACSVVTSHGALSKLTQQLAANNDDMRDAALYAILHIAYQLKDDLSTQHLEKILLGLSQLEITHDSSQLLFIVSCHKDFLTLNIAEEFLQKILEALHVSIDNYLNNTGTELIYLIRSLANMNVEKTCRIVLEYFNVHNLSVKCKVLFERDVSASLLWLLGNLFNFCSDNVFFVNLLT